MYNTKHAKELLNLSNVRQVSIVDIEPLGNQLIDGTITKIGGSQYETSTIRWLISLLNQLGNTGCDFSNCDLHNRKLSSAIRVYLIYKLTQQPQLLQTNKFVEHISTFYTGNCRNFRSD